MTQTIAEVVDPKELLGITLDMIYSRYPAMQPAGVKSRMLDAIRVLVFSHVEEALGTILVEVNDQIASKETDIEELRRFVQLQIMGTNMGTSRCKKDLGYDEIKMMREIDLTDVHRDIAY